MKIYDYMNLLILRDVKNTDELGNGLHYAFDSLKKLAKKDINAEVLPLNKNSVAVIVKEADEYCLYLVVGTEYLLDSIQLVVKDKKLESIYRYYQTQLLG